MVVFTTRKMGDYSIGKHDILRACSFEGPILSNHLLCTGP